MKQRLIVGITGATGIAYGVRLLQTLRDLDVETHLVVSKAGELTRAYETGYSAQELRGLATHHYAPQDIAAPISSGSFRTLGMVIIPCSARTLGEVATGVTRLAPLIASTTYRRPLPSPGLALL